MSFKNISEAEPSAQMEAVRKSEEICIGKAGRPVARLRADEAAAKRRVAGALAGKILMEEDFDAPLPSEIAKAFGIIQPSHQA